MNNLEFALEMKNIRAAGHRDDDIGLPRLRVSRRWWGGEAIPTVACVWQ